MNKESISKYVKVYQDILDKYQIKLSAQDLDRIYQLILLVFELDDLYDIAEQFPPNQARLTKIKDAMLSLMPERDYISLQAVETVFQSMEKESLLSKNKFFSLDRYLEIARQSVGAPIIMAYLVSKLEIKPSIWYLNQMVFFNEEINTLIRLGNDYLDIDKDELRSSKENFQIKANIFFINKFQFKGYIFLKYFIHKIRYFFYSLKFKCFDLTPDRQSYLQAISCSESVLDWAFKVYIIDRNSCQ